ncbi:hypothetical protein SAMN05660479_02360 [Microbulbifer thermotolerans]|uniref:hypothetical protein n=1 Tax=Microbulbifer thermotolerans TaxID=252514 RepID=UPI0008EEC77A|nr:hypothetical protein [Microbulbifer thermotolerans]SFC74842.1 hypothetical protein SAMN05660479_02360 [Microbulbifer thermotolerans]
MIKFIPLTGLLFVGSTQAVAMEGCYLKSDEITSLVSNESEGKLTYIEVSKVADDFFVDGVIQGGNFHVCHIGSPLEGDEGPLKMAYVDNTLVYSEDDPEYDINCKLVFSFEGGKLTISDTNAHCARYIFSCGAHAGLDGVVLPKVERKCPGSDT